MVNTTRARDTLEFKQEAVRLVEGGPSIAAAARSLGVVNQTLFNWGPIVPTGSAVPTASRCAPSK